MGLVNKGARPKADSVIRDPSTEVDGILCSLALAKQGR